MDQANKDEMKGWGIYEILPWFCSKENKKKITIYSNHTFGVICRLLADSNFGVFFFYFSFL